MSYNGIVEMARSQSLLERIAACAAAEGVESPWEWAMAHSWHLAATPGWEESWGYGTAANDPVYNPDTGARTDVITDQAILAAVQAHIAEHGGVA